MDDWYVSFDPVPPSYAERVKCAVCGQTYWSDELYLNPLIDMYCCRKWPICMGTGTEIIWLDDDFIE